jgi:uncharacterized protein (TIGR02266 family)
MSDDATPRVPFDRRDFERIPARVEIRFAVAEDAAKALLAYSINISAGGLCLKTQKPYDVGQELLLNVKIEQEAFELKGVVSWARGGALGVRFVEVSGPDLKRLEGVCAKLRG